MASGQPKPRGWSFKQGAPIIRGYDTPALFRHASLERVKYLANQVRDSQRRIEKLNSELAKGAQRIRQLSKDIRQKNYEN